MKIDKRNPRHWMQLAAFFLQVCVGVLLRTLLFRTKDARLVILYGHKLNGNLLAIYNFLSEHPQYRISPVFLTMDDIYRRELELTGVRVCSAAEFSCALLLARADALISDHGLHSMQPLLCVYKRLKLYFFDVWHGIPFKGFGPEDFYLQHQYDEIWVASDLCRSQLYIDRYGFSPERVYTTGYARTDQLIEGGQNSALLRQELGLPAKGSLILFAPTWAQDTRGRSIYPFDHDEAEFLLALSTLAERHGATVLLRSHLNSGEVGGKTLPPRIVALPGSRYPDAEGILLVSDILICDWSSIAFDYLLLGRPTVFLDITPPFRKGFSLGPEYRFGPVVKDLPALLHQLDRCLSVPDTYWTEYAERHKTVISRVYAEMAEGGASQRCAERLLTYIERTT